MSTFTYTGTYTESDVKAVMQNTYEDIIGFANRNLITYETAENWIEELTYVLKKKVVKFFEIQLSKPTMTGINGYKYTVDSYGYLSTGENSGGISYYTISADCKITLFVELDTTHSDYREINEDLHKNRGWGTGNSLGGTVSHDRNYVSNDLRFQRGQIIK